jgi:hypothetical protein
VKTTLKQDEEEKLQASKGPLTAIDEQHAEVLPSEVPNLKLDELRPAGTLNTLNNSALLLKTSKSSDEDAKM